MEVFYKRESTWSRMLDCLRLLSETFYVKRITATSEPKKKTEYASWKTKTCGQGASEPWHESADCWGRGSEVAVWAGSRPEDQTVSCWNTTSAARSVTVPATLTRTPHSDVGRRLHRPLTQTKWSGFPYIKCSLNSTANCMHTTPKLSHREHRCGLV